MKALSIRMIVALAFLTLLASCNDSSSVAVATGPPPLQQVPLAWDQGSWDQVLWQ